MSLRKKGFSNPNWDRNRLFDTFLRLRQFFQLQRRTFFSLQKGSSPSQNSIPQSPKNWFSEEWTMNTCKNVTKRVKRKPFLFEHFTVHLCLCGTGIPSEVLSRSFRFVSSLLISFLFASCFWLNGCLWSVSGRRKKMLKWKEWEKQPVSKTVKRSRSPSSSRVHCKWTSSVPCVQRCFFFLETKQFLVVWSFQTTETTKTGNHTNPIPDYILGK